jgi:hypothetical protein
MESENETIATGLPAANKTSTELIRPCSQGVGAIDEEFVPCRDILFQLAEAHETAIGHPVWVTAGVGTSVAQDDTLFDRVLAFGSFVNVINGGL